MISSQSSHKSFSLTTANRVFNLVFAAVGCGFLAVAGYVAFTGHAHALLAGGIVAVFGVLLLLVTMNNLRMQLQIGAESIDYRTLFSNKHIEMRDVMKVWRHSVRGTRFLNVRTSQGTATFSNQTFSDHDLDEMEQLIRTKPVAR